MKYVVDVDGTICTQTTGRNYWDAVVWPERVAVINQLYDEGHTITYWTARGTVTKIDWFDITEKQFLNNKGSLTAPFFY